MVHAIFLNIGQMIGTGVFSTRILPISILLVTLLTEGSCVNFERGRFSWTQSYFPDLRLLHCHATAVRLR